MKQNTSKIILYSAYPLNSHNANSIRMLHFKKVLKINLNINTLYPIFPLAKNNQPLWWRLLRESISGIELTIRLLFTNYKLIILSSPPYITILISSLFLALFKRKYILDIRDPYPEVFFELNLFSSKSLLGNIIKSLTKFIYKKSSGIATATIGIKKIIENYNIKNEINCFYNGFDKDLFFPKNFEEKYNRFTLIFHGNLAKMQNIDLLVSLAQKCPKDIDVIVAGSGPQVEKIKQEKKIKFLSKLSHENIADIINKSHVGLSFRKDGLMGKISFPVKIFEYIGAGLPVISTPLHTEAGSFLEKNHLGFQFTNNELDKILEKIIHIKNNYQINKTCVNLTRQAQAKKFSEFVCSVLKKENVLIK